MSGAAKRNRPSNFSSKLSQRVATLMKKADDLRADGCEVLVLVKHGTRWYEFCSETASILFFGLQAAKEQLEEVVTWTSTWKQPSPAKESRVPLKFKKQITDCKQSVATASTSGDIRHESNSNLVWSQPAKAADRRPFTGEVLAPASPVDELILLDRVCSFDDFDAIFDS